MQRPLNISKGFYVYGLIDPRDNTIFYIGMGKNKPYLCRYMVHEKQAKKGDMMNNSHKFRKISQILKEGLSVKYTLLFETDNFEEVKQKEIDLISFYKNPKLTNIAPGGLGGNTGVSAMKGKKLPDWWKAKLSAAKKGKPGNKKGFKLSQESIDKIKKAREKQQNYNHPRYIPIDKELQEKIFQLAEQGVCYFTIGKMLNISRGKVASEIKLKNRVS